MIAPKGADSYLLRFPDGLRDRLKARAGESGRSLNTEIIAAIERHLATSDKMVELEARIARLERQSL